MAVVYCIKNPIMLWVHSTSKHWVGGTNTNLIQALKHKYARIVMLQTMSSSSTGQKSRGFVATSKSRLLWEIGVQGKAHQQSVKDNVK